MTSKKNAMHALHCMNVVFTVSINFAVICFAEPCVQDRCMHAGDNWSPLVALD